MFTHFYVLSSGGISRERHSRKTFISIGGGRARANYQPYLAILRNSADFGQITAANAMKWDATEPSRNSFNFNSENQIVNLDDQNGQMMLRGHTCVWHSRLPSWISNGVFDSATPSSIVQNRCSTVVRQWAVSIGQGGACPWDENLNKKPAYEEILAGWNS
ncbi:hypothetical protein ACEPAH_7859 [Sanghuangporus vaninii]